MNGKFSTDELMNSRVTLDTAVIFNAMIKGKAFNTLKTYKSGIRPWKSFAAENGLQIFPICKVEFAIFLITKCEAGASWASLNNYINAAKCFLNLFCKNNSGNGLVDFQVLHFLKKCSRKPDNKMRPLIKREFDIIIHTHILREKSLLKLRNLTILIFAWIGFLRYDDVSQIKLSNVNISNDVVQIKLSDAKNDRFKKGQSIVFRLNPMFLSILNDYMASAKMNSLLEDSNVFLFCDIVLNKCFYYKRLSYEKMREMLLGLCRVAGVDTKKLGTHSLRIGGCTEASRMGVPDYIIDYYGRWALNSTSRARYQRVVGEEALMVSEFLNF